MPSSRSSSRHKREYQGYDSGGETPPDHGEKPTDPNINYPATGAPFIEGTAEYGEVLFANTSLIQDQNGLRPFTYQWQRDNNIDIPNTNSANYVVQAGDIGSPLRVYVTFVDGDGYPEGPLYSDYTSIVPGTNLPPEGIPVIVGNPIEAQQLTCNVSGISDPDGINQSTWAYQWQRGVQFGEDPDFRQWENIPGATSSTYILLDTEVDRYIRVYVYFDDNLGKTEGPLYSEEIGLVVEYNREATGKPSITGDDLEGETLTAGPGDIADENGFDPAGISYYWQRNGTDLPRSPSTTYTLVADDVDQTITVRAAFIDDAGYAEERISDPVGPIREYNRTATGRPTISGTPSVGYTLTAGPGDVADYNGLGPFNWKWYRGDTEIPGQTGTTYELASADIGQTIKVSVEFTDQRGYPEGPLFSFPTEVVTTTDGYFHDFSHAAANTPGFYSLGGFEFDRQSTAWGTGHLQRIIEHSVGQEVYTGSGPAKNDDVDVGYGVQLENAQTNHLLHSNSLDNAAWSKTDVSISGTQVTVDADDGTLTQAVTLASGERTFSIAITRVNGVGTVEISAGDDVWVEVDAQAHFQRLSTSQTAANPVIGVRFGAAGDIFNVEFGQLEDGNVVTSYIDTTTTPVLRQHTHLTGQFSNLGDLPPEGVSNDFCGQFVFMLRRSAAEIYNNAGGEVIFAEIYNVINNNDAVELALTSATNMQLRVRVNSTNYALNYDVSGQGPWSVLDVRFLKNNMSPGWVGWLNGARQEDASATAGASALMNRMSLGSDDAGTSHADINFLMVRLFPVEKTEPEIEAWAGWDVPPPQIAQQPPNDTGDRGEILSTSVTAIHPFPVFQWQHSEDQVVWTNFQNGPYSSEGERSTTLYVRSNNLPSLLWVKCVISAFNDPTKQIETALASLNVTANHLEYFHDFSLSNIGTWPHERDSEASGADYTSTIIEVPTNEPMFIGGQYNAPNDWTDQQVGYGLQLNRAITNECAYSEDYQTGPWSTTGIVNRSAWHDANSPTGRQVKAILESTSTGIHQINNSFLGDSPGVVGDYCVTTVYVLMNGRKNLNMRFRTDDNTYSSNVLDLEALTTSSSDCTLERYGPHGWIKVVHWKEQTASPTVKPQLSLRIRNDAGEETYTGDGVSGIYMTAVQHEYVKGPPVSSPYVLTDTGASRTMSATAVEALFSVLDPLPSSGVINDFCYQQTGVWRDAEVVDGDTTSKNISSLYNKLEFGRSAMPLQAWNGFTSVPFELDGPLVGATYMPAIPEGSYYDIRFRKRSGTESEVGDGLTSWLWIDGVYQGKFIGKDVADGVTPIDCSDDFAVPINNVELTRNFGEGQSHQNVAQVRIAMGALSDAEIEAWPTWTPPDPRIITQPGDIHIGTALPDAPYITGQPQPQTAAVDEEVAFMVIAVAGTQPLSYSWESDKSGSFRPIDQDYPSYSGEDTATLLLTPRFSSDDSNIRCVVTNASGTTYTQAAALTVT